RLGEPREEVRRGIERARRAPELALGRAHDLAAQELGPELEPVADPEHGDPEAEDLAIDRGRVALVDGRGAARQDHAPRAPHLRGAGRERDDLRVDAVLAHAPRDELRVLRAEVEDEDLL